MEQEPRTVSTAGPPLRKVRAFPGIEAFLSKHHVRCQRFGIQRTFRSIKYREQKQKNPRAQPFAGKPLKEVPMKVEAATEPTAGVQPEVSQEVAAKPAGPKAISAMQIVPAEKAGSVVEGEDAELPPWEQYFKLNNHFVRQGHFMHTVAWEANGRRILTVIPHPTRVDVDRLARAVKEPRSAVKQRKLKDISKETGFAVFVCPPFGHSKDAQGREPLLLIDSMVAEFKKPLLFDCGSVGLSVPVSEFFRSTGAACIEGLGKVATLPVVASKSVKPMGAMVEEEPAKSLETPSGASARSSSPEASPEPAPEPGLQTPRAADCTMNTGTDKPAFAIGLSGGGTAASMVAMES